MKKRICLLTPAIIALLLLREVGFGEETPTTKPPEQEKAALPASAPERSHLIPIGSVVATVEGRTIGLFMLYNDPRTERPIDYMELYDAKGRLLSIHWIDEFGIARMAVDQALLEGDEEPTGILVMLTEGTEL